MTDTPEIARIRAALEAYDDASYYAQCDELQDACSTNSIRQVLAHIDAQAAEIERLKDAEEGAKEAFEVVAQSKHAMLANEIKMQITIAKVNGLLRERGAEIERLRSAITTWDTATVRAPHGVEVIVTLAPVRKGAKSKVAFATRWSENSRGHAGPAEWSAHDDQINTPIAWMKMPTPYVAALASPTEEKS